MRRSDAGSAATPRLACDELARANAQSSGFKAILTQPPDLPEQVVNRWEIRIEIGRRYPFPENCGRGCSLLRQSSRMQEPIVRVSSRTTAIAGRIDCRILMV